MRGQPPVNCRRVDGKHNTVKQADSGLGGGCSGNTGGNPEIWLDFAHQISASWPYQGWDSSCWPPASPPFLFYFLKQPGHSVVRLWMFCRRILTIQGRMIMRSKIYSKLKTVDRVVFPEMKLEKVLKKSLASPAAVKPNGECSKVWIWLWSFPKSKLISELFQTPKTLGIYTCWVNDCCHNNNNNNGNSCNTARP